MPERCPQGRAERAGQDAVRGGTNVDGQFLPPSLGAGLQVAYLLNEERQTNRKTSQFVITAFVSFTTSVGQLR